MIFNLRKKEIQISIFIAFITLALYLFYLSKYQFQIGALMGVSNHVESQLISLPKSIPIFINQGHDGGYVWAVAKNPFSPNLKETSFHYERWLYPFTAWLFSFGQNDNLIWSMPFVNFVSTILIAYFAALFFNQFNLSPWWALLVALGPGASMPLRFNLVDQYALLWAMLAYYSYHKQNYGLFSLFASLAFLSRPTSIGIILVGALAILSNVKQKFLWALLPLMGLLPFFALKFYWINYKGLPIAYLPNGEGKFSIPFISLTKDLTPLLRQSGTLKTMIFFFTVTLYLSTFGYALVNFAKIYKLTKKFDFDSMVISGFSLAALSMEPIMLIGGTMQVARFTPIFPLLIRNTLNDINSNKKITKYFAKAILTQIILATLIGLIWIIFSPPMAKL